MQKYANVNQVDVEEYPSTAEIEKRCVSFLGRLWNAPLHSPDEEALGVSTVGSSYVAAFLCRFDSFPISCLRISNSLTDSNSRVCPQ